MKKTQLIILVMCLFMATGSAFAVTPSIKANDSAGSVNVASGQDLRISINLAIENSNAEADWWVVCETEGNWFSYIFPVGWSSGLNPTLQAGLMNVPDFTVFDDSFLSSGTYTFYFGVDLNRNGAIDSPLYYDSVVVTIEDSNSASEEVSSSYQITNTVDASDCGEGVHTYTRIWDVTQNGNTVTVAGSDYDGDPFVLSGTLSGGTLNVSGSYAEDSGTTSLTASLAVGHGSFSGTGNWTWSNGYYSCSGSDQISGVEY